MVLGDDVNIIKLEISEIIKKISRLKVIMYDLIETRIYK
jgi:hypothetical protein